MPEAFTRWHLVGLSNSLALITSVTSSRSIWGVSRKRNSFRRRLGKVRYLLITMPKDASDAELARLRGLGNLSSLNIRGTRISDDGMTHLKGLTNLRTLNLSGTQVTDAGLVL